MAAAFHRSSVWPGSSKLPDAPAAFTISPLDGGRGYFPGKKCLTALGKRWLRDEHVLHLVQWK